VATWQFFYDRIPYEEQKLVQFFGDSYIQYRKRSYIGIPLVFWASKTFKGW
jgi:protein-S-isoprenylcysteine O-methyltransferase